MRVTSAGSLEFGVKSRRQVCSCPRQIEVVLDRAIIDAPNCKYTGAYRIFCPMYLTTSMTVRRVRLAIAGLATSIC